MWFTALVFIMAGSAVQAAPKRIDIPLPGSGFLSPLSGPNFLFSEPLELEYVNGTAPGGVCGRQKNGDRVCIGQIPERGGNGEDLYYSQIKDFGLLKGISWLRDSEGLKIWGADSSTYLKNYREWFENPPLSQVVWASDIPCGIADDFTFRCAQASFATQQRRNVSRSQIDGFLTLDTVPENARTVGSRSQVCWYTEDHYRCWWGFDAVSNGWVMTGSTKTPYLPLPKAEFAPDLVEVYPIDDVTCISTTKELVCRWRYGNSSDVKLGPEWAGAHHLAGQPGRLCGVLTTGELRCVSFYSPLNQEPVPKEFAHPASPVRSIQNSTSAVCVDLEDNTFGCWNSVYGQKINLPQAFSKVKKFSLALRTNEAYASDLLCALLENGKFDCLAMPVYRDFLQSTLTPYPKGTNVRTFIGNQCVAADNEIHCPGGSWKRESELNQASQGVLLDVFTGTGIYCGLFQLASGEKKVRCARTWLSGMPNADLEGAPLWDNLIVPANTVQLTVRANAFCLVSDQGQVDCIDPDKIIPALPKKLRQFFLADGSGGLGVALDSYGLILWPKKNSLSSKLPPNIWDDAAGIISVALGARDLCVVWDYIDGVRRKLDCYGSISAATPIRGFTDVQNILMGNDIACVSLPKGVACFGALAPNLSVRNL